MWKIYQFLCFWAWFDVKFYVELKEIYLMGSKVQSKAIRAQKRNLNLIAMKFLEVVWPIHRSETLCWAQKRILFGFWYTTGNHESPKTRNSNKLWSKNPIFSVKKISVVFIWNWKYFLQFFSKIILKHIISFMNRKYSCG
jgi:hypothetical protein